jgi:hypothetical protein
MIRMSMTCVHAERVVHDFTRKSAGGEAVAI